MYNQLDGNVINKPIAVIGKALDLRSQVYENGVYRNYSSTSEAISKLTGISEEHTAEIRQGLFMVHVEDVEGTVTPHWFLSGTADDHLVPVFPEAATINEGSAF